MRCALVGMDEQTWPLVQAALADGHVVGWTYELGAWADEFRAAAPNAFHAEHWEDLLAGDIADLVIVSHARNEDIRAEQLRKLAASGRRLVVSHPTLGSSLVCYELQMVCDENQTAIRPLSLMREHPACDRLRTLCGAATPATDGAGVQLQIERRAADRSAAAVKRWFARDVDFARRIVGELTRVGAMAPGTGSVDYSTLGVQLRGPEGAAVRWSMGAIEEEAGAVVSLSTAVGRARLWIPDAFDGTWRLESRQGEGGPAAIEEYPAGVAASTAWRRIDEAYDPRSAASAWLDACRSLELTEAVDRSLARGKTVELLAEEASEAGNFKGAMSAIGCGLLLLLLCVFVGALMLRSQVESPLLELAPYAIAALLGGFLLVQLLLFLIPRR